MIIVRLIGGLGNQMFQYAVGRHLACIRSDVLKLDATHYEIDDLRGYGLGAFKIIERFATPEEINRLSMPQISGLERVARRLLNKPPMAPATRIQDRPRGFKPGILQLSGPIYLDGYWQSERYFHDIESVIRSEFVMDETFVDSNRLWFDRISACESISLHVRRGDFVSDLDAQQEHGVCDLAYYLRCIDYIVTQVAAPHFFVFSDDSEWAQEFLELEHPMTFINRSRDRKDYEDLGLMSRCKHHIIANSTFSWWGAWLNPRNDKIVMAPKNWYTSENRNAEELGDLIPSSWHLL